MKHCVLVVDDEQDVLDVFTEMLQSLGCKVYSVYSGEKALEMMSAIKFDLIITDLIMPEMDGLNFLRRVRMTGDDTPAVITAGIDPRLSAMDFEEYGVSDFIVKPFDFNDIHHKVCKYLNKENVSGMVV